MYQKCTRPKLMTSVNVSDQILLYWRNLIGYSSAFYRFQSSVLLHIGTSHLTYTANQITGFSMENSTLLKWVNFVFFLMFREPYQFWRQILSEFEHINWLLFPMTSSGNLLSSYDFKENKSLEAATKRCSYKKLFCKYAANLQENTFY